LRVDRSDGGAEARVSGELDLATYESALSALTPIVEAEGQGDVVLDLAELSFVDSSGIRLFIKLQQALGDRGRLVLRAPQPQVVKVIEIAGLRELGIRVDPDPA
jgi:anti-anti-sigma factor